MSLPLVQPQQALLAVAGCPARPRPSGAASKQLPSTSQGSPDSLVLPSEEYFLFVGPDVWHFSSKNVGMGGMGERGEAVSPSMGEERPAGNN